MSYNIGVISPSETMTEKFTAEIRRRNLDNILVRQCTKHQAIENAHILISQGARVFISRGQTARAIRAKFDLPVVDVRHTFFDCYNAYLHARRHGGRVAFLVLSERFADIIRKSILLMEQVEMVEIFDTENAREIRERLLAVKRRGVEVMIGGLTLKEVVESIGCVYVMTETDVDSVRDSIDEALHSLRVEMERNEQAKELENRYETIVSIFQCVSDAVVSIDRTGVITNANTKAVQILGKNSIGRVISERLQTGVFNEVLRTGVAVTGEVISFGLHSLVVNAEPICVNNGIDGATITLQQSKHILAAEQKIRTIMVDKGHRSDKTFGDIVGDSKALRDTKALAMKYAAADGTVLLLGETGTGKELFAQSIHNASRRFDAPFVAINCASLPLNILESELFGYVKGAFTGARSEGKAGFFELAHHGTIFLDEISETPLDVQLRLLRVLQERKTMRIGDDKLIPVDVRIITASNKDLTQLVQRGLFREDLYYRICVLELHLPSLRRRREDIPALVEHLMRRDGSRAPRMSPAALALLVSRDWPGNVRQLQNIIERVRTMCEGDTISLELVERALDDGGGAIASSGGGGHDVPAPRTPLREDKTERELIRRVLTEARGNRKAAAERLGVSTTTLWRTIKRITDQDKTYFDMVKYGVLDGER